MDGDSSGAIKRLAKEQALVEKKPVAGVTFAPGGESTPLEWTMSIVAPDMYVVNGEERKSPYGGRVFPVKIKFPSNYPYKAPTVIFPHGSLYHPNVHIETGEICVAESFGPTKNVTDVAKTVVDFLKMPHLQSPVDLDVASEMATALPKYEDKARKAAEKVPMHS